MPVNYLYPHVNETKQVSHNCIEKLLRDPAVGPSQPEEIPHHPSVRLCWQDTAEH